MKNNILIIGVISYENVETYKRKPIIDLQNICMMLYELEYVDIVIADCIFGGISK